MEIMGIDLDKFLSLEFLGLVSLIGGVTIGAFAENPLDVRWRSVLATSVLFLFLCAVLLLAGFIQGGMDSLSFGLGWAYFSVPIYLFFLLLPAALFGYIIGKIKSFFKK